MRALSLSRGLLLALALWGCGPDSDSPPPTDPLPPVSAPPTTAPPTTTPAVAIISAAGGNVTLPSRAELSFPPGALPPGTRVEIKDVATFLSDPDLVAASAMVEATNISSRSIEVTVTGAQPSSNVSVKLILPASYITNLPAGQTTRILALSSNESELEAPSASYLIVPVSVNASDSSITFSARPEFFAFETAGNHVARFVWATTP